MNNKLNNLLTLKVKYLLQIMEQVKEHGLVIGSFAHDNDSSSAKIILEYFPKAKEHLDIGHYSKNIRKKIIELYSKQKLPDAKGYGERVRRDFIQVVRKYSGNPNKIKEKIENFVNHYQRKCTETCDHPKDYIPKYSPLTNPTTIQAFKEILNNITQNVTKIAAAKSSNTVESLNRMFCRECPKDKDNHHHYGMGCNIAVLRKNSGVISRCKILEKIGFTVSECSIFQHKRTDKQREKNSQRKRSQKYKKKRQEYKTNKRKNGQKVLDKAHTYKGQTGGVENVACNTRICKCKTGCGTRCGCKNGCSVECKCVNCANIIKTKHQAEIEQENIINYDSDCTEIDEILYNDQDNMEFE